MAGILPCRAALTAGTCGAAGPLAGSVDGSGVSGDVGDPLVGSGGGSVDAVAAGGEAARPCAIALPVPVAVVLVIFLALR